MAREMKDSGIEWIGEIPCEWDIKRLKNLAVVIRGGSPRPIEDYLSTDDTGYNWIRIGDSKKGSKYIDSTARKIIPDGIYKTRLVKKGSLILSNSMSFGQPYILKIDGCIHDGWVALSDIIIHKEFMYYFLISESARSQFQYQVAGGVVQNLNIDKIGSTFLPIPDYKIQQSIADYLDDQCAHIDSVIEKTRAAIEEYKKLKQAVITQAVTKGIRPNRKMKDSGIEWIGKTPEEWKILKTKYVFKIKKDIANEEGYQVLSITQRGIIPKDLSKNEGQIAANYSNYQIVNIGDFAMNHMDLLTGWVDISKYYGVTSPDYRVFRLFDTDNNNSRYYLYLMQLCYFNRVFYGLGQGVSGMGRWRLQADKFLNMYIVNPSFEEQSEIVAYLDEKTAAIDSLIQKEEQLITELEAYKKSLIYEYVTGKKEVKADITVEYSPEFKKALLMCRILELTQCKGRIHLQKTFFAIDTLLNLFSTQYYRFEHGPYDLDIESYEKVIEENGWLNIYVGKSIRYNKTNTFSDYFREYEKVFGDRDDIIQRICKVFNVPRTTKAEKIATLLAVWNDFLINGIEPTDDMIIDDVITNWTPNKANVSRETWSEFISKIRENNIVPKGYGKHTKRMEELVNGKKL